MAAGNMSCPWQRVFNWTATCGFDILAVNLTTPVALPWSNKTPSAEPADFQMFRANRDREIKVRKWYHILRNDLCRGWFFFFFHTIRLCDLGPSDRGSKVSMGTVFK